MTTLATSGPLPAAATPTPPLAPAAAPRADAAARAWRERAPFLPALVTVAVFLPEALGFVVFGFRLTPGRLVLLALAPVMVLSFAHLIGSHRYRFVLSDLFMPAALAWMIIALATTGDIDVALKSGGAAGLDLVGPYLLMRGLLSTRGQIHGVVRLFCIVAAIAGPLGLADTLAGSYIVHDALGKLTGYAYFHPLLVNSVDLHRLGLFRAEGIFPHPILFGIVMCYALMLTEDVRGAARPLCRIGTGIGLFLSLSSAPWMGLILGLALLAYLRLAPFPHRWLVLLTVAALVSGAVFIFVPNPFSFIFRHFTLQPETAWYRLLIWQYAGFDVMKSPVIGIGVTQAWFRPGWMGASVDSLWLGTAMAYGIPGALLTGFALLGASSLPVVRRPANAARIDAREVRLSDALGIITFLTIFLGLTVDYWGSSVMIVGLLAGARASLGQIAAA
ncbi:MAG TPA: O-antigen ligase family protein [Stellaceae bacterium]|nr:O-antigen ligase family protein [Stellaceae bacterium]